MSKIKDKIINEFNKETPNVKSHVLSSIEKETQLEVTHAEREKKSFFTILKRVTFAFSFCLVFIIGFFSGYIIPKNNQNVPPVAEISCI